MDKNKIPVDKVTKPIQLLAAWLTGLIIINGAFLTAANTLSAPTWAIGLLVVAAVLNVPVFLFAIFLLQTKFRPEMQEDSFYSKYLESKTGTIRQPVTNNQLNKLKEDVFEANTNTIELVANLQEEINNISFKVENGQARPINSKDATELEKKIRLAANASAWNQYQIRLNKYLSNSTRLKKCLVASNIPIHSTFGVNGHPLTDPPIIMIGGGFDIEHLRQFLNSINDEEVSTIAFAFSELPEENEDYNRTVLIGAYNDHDYGLNLRDAVELINKNGIDIDAFYSAIQH